MIIMIVVSLLGVAASQMVLLSERSARYDRDAQIAYQAAEAALMDAEFDLRGPNSSVAKRVDNFSTTSQLGFENGCGQGVDLGLCLPSTGTKELAYTIDFTDQSAGAKTVKFGDFTGRTLAFGTSGPQPAQLPRYIIELIPDQTSTSPGKYLHRVTAVGFGPRKETQAVLQMVFKKEK